MILNNRTSGNPLHNYDLLNCSISKPPKPFAAKTKKPKSQPKESEKKEKTCYGKVIATGWSTNLEVTPQPPP